jgi:hypothetical protein
MTVVSVEDEETETVSTGLGDFSEEPKLKTSVFDKVAGVVGREGDGETRRGMMSSLVGDDVITAV